MNKTLTALVIVCLALITGCPSKSDTKNYQPSKIYSEPTADNFRYTGSIFKGNYIWGGAMNLAWNELTDNIVHEKIRLITTDSLALSTLDKLNSPVMTAKDMDDKSYYIKSGFGQKTVTAINKESRRKFPGKSFDDLELKLGDSDIISYAYFLKEVEYRLPFMKDIMSFDNVPVDGFRAKDKSCGNVRILEYKDSDHFLVSIVLKDQADQIFLAKGYPMGKPDSLIAAVRAKAPGSDDPKWLPGVVMDQRDSFAAPTLHFKLNRQYYEMLHKVLGNKLFVGDKLREYEIVEMFENIRFDMDEKGARVENEAVVVLGETCALPAPDAYKPRIMILDKPYWVCMKRFDSNNPYFITGVNNRAFMKAAAGNKSVTVGVE